MRGAALRLGVHGHDNHDEVAVGLESGDAAGRLTLLRP